MDMQKIGGFLKALRRERGLTQEQLAEVLGVAGRTVSRWETAANLPDLSILIQLAEFYNVDIQEILDGERKDRTMDKDIRETLNKVADYGEIEKQRLTRVGKVAFSITFFTCAAAILAQLLLLGDWRYALGESVTLLVGGIAALVMTARGGLWDASSKRGRTPLGDGVLSLGMGILFTVLFALATRSAVGDAADAPLFTAAFFALISLASFAVLRGFAAWNRRARAKSAAGDGRAGPSPCGRAGCRV